MKSIVFYLFFALNSFAYSQNIHEGQKNIYLAQHYIKTNKKTAHKYYKRAFRLYQKANSYDYLDAATNAFEIGKNKDAERFLRDAITQQEAPLEFIQNYATLQPYKTRKSFTNIIDNYSKLRAKYYQNIQSLDAYFKIKNLVVKDQMIRDSAFNAFRQKCPNSSFDLMDVVDSINIQFIQIVTKYYASQSIFVFKRKTFFLYTIATGNSTN